MRLVLCRQPLDNVKCCWYPVVISLTTDHRGRHRDKNYRSFDVFRITHCRMLNLNQFLFKLILIITNIGKTEENWLKL